MKKYCVGIEVKQGEVEEILKELDEAQEKIYECYNRLLDVGVLTVSKTEESASET